MYSTCIFCHADLGKNEVVEHFPVGRRLAFDAARGRLWVVCRKCVRWNLTPLEERWEAIEECERLFSATKLRVSTDHVGLARLREGLELIRIGEPQRPELAAWRYGTQFARRRRRHLAYTGLAISAGIGFLVAGPITGVIAGGTGGLSALNLVRNLVSTHRTRVRMLVPGEPKPVALKLADIRSASVEPDGDGWALSFNYTRNLQLPFNRPLVPSADARLTGEAAARGIGQLLPALNETGAKQAEIDDAIALIESAGDRDALFRKWITPMHASVMKAGRAALPALHLSTYEPPVRLAFEMAAHEESERRALEGELSILEEAWREAEEIASIADGLFVSDATRDQLDRLRRARDEER
jgi:hypothetical protein